MANDALSEIRSIRRQISRECNDQPDKVFDYYQGIQERLKASGKFTFVNTRIENAKAGHATEQTDAAEP